MMSRSEMMACNIIYITLCLYCVGMLIKKRGAEGTMHDKVSM